MPFDSTNWRGDWNGEPRRSIWAEVVPAATCAVLVFVWFAATAIFVKVSKSHIPLGQPFMIVWWWAMWGLLGWWLVLLARWVRRWSAG
jgi:hypothetical protein